MCSHINNILLATLFACGGNVTEIYYEEYDRHEPSVVETIQKQDLSYRRMLLNPQPEITDEVLESIDRYRERLGLIIEISENGIQVNVVPEVWYNKTKVDALASYKRLCGFDECKPSETKIQIAEVMLTDKHWALQNTVDHEIGHIVSKWGNGKLMHLGPGNMMSPGCVNNVCYDWTEEDAVLLCSFAPCTKIITNKGYL